jgi:hypothetical protein
MLKNTLFILLTLVVFALGAWLGARLLGPKPRPVEESTVLLERIREVCKLTTVEGQFSEIYNYNEYQGYFTWLWDKKVLVRVQATVSAGYDLDNLQLEMDSAARVVRLRALPEPQILSIDHTMDYYDISNGLFTEFSAEDYNRIHARAKALIREQALKSNLLPAARAQGEKIWELVRFMAESAGWKTEGLPQNSLNL